jgi:selenocysteine lyase/cysteine desulfurase
MSITPDDFFAPVDRVRDLFAKLVGVADPTRIAIMPAVSYGISIAARNLRLGRGSRVVLLGEQFPSNVYPWYRACAESGAIVDTVSAPESTLDRARRWNERLLETIGTKTAVVAVPQVHWTDGTRFDLKAVGRRAREVGAALIVDGTQSVGAMPFDVSSIQPDALVCAGYKWLLGPYAIGMAYFGPRFDQGIPLEEGWITRMGSDNFSRLVDYEASYQPRAIRFDVGERSNFILVPMMAAALEQINSWSPDAIQAYCDKLAAPFLIEFATLGYEVEDAALRGSHLFGIRLGQHVDVETLLAALKKRKVSVSVRGSAVRVAPNVYNEPRDFEALLETLDALRGR